MLRVRRGSNMRVKAVLLALVVSSTLVSAQPQQPPTFRSGVDLIEVDVTVLDDRGNPVPDLLAPEFAVTVDGEERRIVSVEFIKVDGPSEKPGVETPGLDPYYSTNQGAVRGQLVMLVVDQGNIRFGGGRAMIASASQFLDQLGPADRVAFAAIPRIGDDVVGFTANHALVRSALERVAGHSENLPTRFAMSVAEAISLNRHRERAREPGLVARSTCGPLISNELVFEDCMKQLLQEANDIATRIRQQTLESLRALRALVSGLGEIDGPKWLVLISQGLIIDDVELVVAEVASAAAAARVTIHALLLDTLYGDAPTRQSPLTPGRDRQLWERGLDMLSAQAGGSLYRGTSDTVFQRLRRQLSGFYVLGVETDPRDRDGAPHQIQVDVRRLGTTVWARRQFQVSTDAQVAQTAKTDEELLTQALRAPFPITDLPLRVTTYAYHDAGTSKVRVLLAAEIEQAEEGASELGIGFAVFDREGRVVADTVERRTRAQVGGESSRVLKYVRGVLVEPGTYTLRLATIDGGGRLGSVEHEMHAWQLLGEPLAVGDLMVDNAPSSPGEAIQPGVDVRLDTGRLAAYLELYANDPGSFQSAEVAVEIAENETGPALTTGAASLRDLDDSRHRAASVIPAGGRASGGPVRSPSDRLIVRSCRRDVGAAVSHPA